MSNLVSLPKMSERESTNRVCDKDARLQLFMIPVGGCVLRRCRQKFFLRRFSPIIPWGVVEHTHSHWGTVCSRLTPQVFVKEDNIKLQIIDFQKPKENSLPVTQNVVIWLKSQLQFLTSWGGWQLSKIYMFDLERSALWYNSLPMHNQLMSHGQPHMGLYMYIYIYIYIHI